VRRIIAQRLKIRRHLLVWRFSDRRRQVSLLNQGKKSAMATRQKASPAPEERFTVREPTHYWAAFTLQGEWQ